MSNLIIRHITESLSQILSRFDSLEKQIDKINKVKNPLDGDEFLDNHDLCNLLGVTKRTLQRYRQKGKVAYYMLDGKPYYKKSELLSFFTKKGKGSKEKDK